MHASLGPPSLPSVSLFHPGTTTKEIEDTREEGGGKQKIPSRMSVHVSEAASRGSYYRSIVHTSWSFSKIIMIPNLAILFQPGFPIPGNESHPKPTYFFSPNFPPTHHVRTHTLQPAPILMTFIYWFLFWQSGFLDHHHKSSGPFVHFDDLIVEIRKSFIFQAIVNILYLSIESWI